MKLSILFVLVAAAFPQTACGQSEYESLSQPAHLAFLSTYIGVINNKQMQAELEIVPSQVAEANERIARAKAEALAIYAQAKEAFGKSRNREQYSQTCDDAYRDYTAEYEAVLNDVLLAHQREQLNRCVLWNMIKTGKKFNTGNICPFQSILQNNVVRELIEIDETQSRKVNERAEQLQDDFAKELAALHDKYEEKVQEVLTEQQREKVKTLAGATPVFFYR